MIAHNIDLFTDHEIAIAKAVPNVIPPRTVSVTPDFAIIIPRLYLMIDNLLSYKGALLPINTLGYE